LPEDGVSPLTGFDQALTLAQVWELHVGNVVLSSGRRVQEQSDNRVIFTLK
jgi:hypothetical protein